MAVLVTGGAGYIGSETVRTLQAEGREVVVIDTLEFGDVRAIPGVPIVQGDIRDTELVRKAVRDFAVDAVVHFGAYKAAGESMEDPHRYFDNNVAATIALLGVLDECEVRNFVFSSSCAVYGTPKVLPVDESHPFGPESPYGESKFLVERILSWYDQCRPIRSVSLRYFNASGASDDARFGEDWASSLNLVPIVMKAALGRRPPVKVFGTDYDTPDGSAIRDYVHVADLADAHIRAIKYLERGGETTAINLGTGTGSSVFEVLASARRASGTEIPLELAPRRPGDPVAVFADNRRATELLDWQPRFGLDDIIDSAWRWHSTHLDGYADA